MSHLLVSQPLVIQPFVSPTAMCTFTQNLLPHWRRPLMNQPHMSLIIATRSPPQSLQPRGRRPFMNQPRMSLIIATCSPPLSLQPPLSPNVACTMLRASPPSMLLTGMRFLAACRQILLPACKVGRVKEVAARNSQRQRCSSLSVSTAEACCRQGHRVWTLISVRVARIPHALLSLCPAPLAPGVAALRV